MDDYMTNQATDRPKFGRLWAWDDASRIANFMTVHFERCKKYGLDMPINNNVKYTKEDLKQREDQLVEYFLYEMRKPASAWRII